MMIMELHANKSLLQLIDIRCHLNLEHHVPFGLRTEIDALGFKRGALLLSCKSRTLGEIRSIEKFDPTVERFEYSLNNRHLLDYEDSQDVSVEHLWKVFLSASALIKRRALELGAIEPIEFLFSLPNPPDTYSSENDAVLTFCRVVDGIRISALEDIEEFKVNHIASLTM